MLDFDLKTDFHALIRKNFDVAVPALLDPNNAAPLVLGEWLELNSSYQAARGTGNATVPSFPMFAEQGRYETQALGSIPLLFGGFFEADTKIFEGTGIVSIGQPLMVADTGVGSQRGLKLNPGGGPLTQAFVTRLPANNNGYLRFIRMISQMS